MSHYDHSNNKSAGFSIVEVLVAVGIMAVVMAGISTMGVNLMTQNKVLQQKLESIELEQSLVKLLADSPSCDCMFQSLNWPASGDITLTQLKNGCGATLLSAGSPVTKNGAGLKISNIKISNLTAPTLSRRTGDIEIEFDPGSLAGPLKSIKISAQSFLVDASNVIQQCVGLAGSPKVCTSLGGSWNATTSICTMVSTGTTANSNATCVAAYGNGWTWNGTTCVPPAGNPPVNNVLAWDSSFLPPGAAIPPACPAGAAAGVLCTPPSSVPCSVPNPGLGSSYLSLTCTAAPNFTPAAGISACFVAGTKVLMASGEWREIESLKVGEKVFGANHQINTIQALHRPLLGDRTLYSINNDVMTTGDHLFMSPNGRWLAIDPELHNSRRYNHRIEVEIENGQKQSMLLSAVKPSEVGSLQVGSHLGSIYGEKFVESISRVRSQPNLQLYSIVTDGNASFVVQGGYYADALPQK